MNSQPKARPASPEKAASADRIDISTKSKEVAEIMSAVEKVPDVREEKVSALKEAIDSGRYTVDAVKVAEKMLSELI